MKRTCSRIEKWDQRERNKVGARRCLARTYRQWLKGSGVRVK